MNISLQQPNEHIISYIESHGFTDVIGHIIVAYAHTNIILVYHDARKAFRLRMLHYVPHPESKRNWTIVRIHQL
jgi:hypothetical protein